MQLIDHKNSGLTVCQRFFIEKSLELLYIGSIDSYRIRLNNPRSVLIELKYCLEQFQEGRIKHFQAIRAKDKEKKAIVDEVLMLLDYNPNYLRFGSISEKYLRQLLYQCNEDNYKRVISAVEILLQENNSYLSTVLEGVSGLLTANVSNQPELDKLDTSLNILFTELIHTGFSKNFLYKLVFGIFVGSLGPGESFAIHFSSFKSRVLLPKSEFQVIFRLDTSHKVYDSISAIHNPQITLSNDVNEVHLTGKKG